MKKALLFLFLSVLSLSLFAQAKPSNFAVTVGLGQVATATSGNALAYDVSFQTNYSLAARYDFSPKFAFGLSATQDTVKLARWLAVHNFLKPIDNDNYQYLAVDALVFYYPVRNEKAALFIMGGPTYYHATAINKVGLTAGIGADYALTKHLFLETAVKFRHVQDFLVPVANVFDAGLYFGWRF